MDTNDQKNKTNFKKEPVTVLVQNGEITDAGTKLHQDLQKIIK